MPGLPLSINQLTRQLVRLNPGLSSTTRLKPKKSNRIKFPKWNPPQKLAWQAVEKASRLTLTLAWGRGVGKSWFLRQFAWIQIAKHDGQLRTNALEPFKGVRIIFLCPTLQQFKDV